MTRTAYLPLQLLILLTASALRLVGLTNVSPPGLAHDEVAHWLIVQDILAGKFALYFTEAYGHEGAYHYWQTLFVLLLGDNALALRLVTVYIGLLLVAVTFALGRELFGARVGLLSMGVTAVLFYPVFYSRLGLRALLLALVAGLMAYFWWRGWHKGQTKYYVLAGLFAGYASYTYMASRALPFFWLAFYLYLLWRENKTVRRHWQQHLLFLTLYVALSLPLVLTLQNITEVRVAEVDAPLRALRQGDFAPIWQNFLAILPMWGW
jgi:4-amino-4-deoxy-L-arabinose transferase-like glycosyltransferase